MSFHLTIMDVELVLYAVTSFGSAVGAVRQTDSYDDVINKRWNNLFSLFIDKNKQTSKKQASKQTKNKQANKQKADKQSNKQTNKQNNKQINNQKKRK